MKDAVITRLHTVTFYNKKTCNLILEGQSEIMVNLIAKTESV